MSRTPIQVPEELKNEIEGLKRAMYARTHYEVIERLMEYYRKNEEQKKREIERQRAEDVTLGPQLKKDLDEFREQMRLKSDADAVQLLLAHFKHSDKLDKETFDLYRALL